MRKKNYNAAPTVSSHEKRKSSYTKGEKAMAATALAVILAGGAGAVAANHFKEVHVDEARVGIEQIQKDFSEASSFDTVVGDVLDGAMDGGGRYAAGNIELAMQLNERGSNTLTYDAYMAGPEAAIARIDSAEVSDDNVLTIPYNQELQDRLETVKEDADSIGSLENATRAGIATASAGVVGAAVASFGAAKRRDDERSSR